MDLVALGLIVLVPLAWRKGWRAIGVGMAVLALVYGLSIQEWVQKLVTLHMSPVVRQQIEDEKDIRALREDLQKLDQRLGQQQAALDAQTARLGAQDTAIAAGQDALEAVRTDLRQTQQRLEGHHEQLAGVGSLVQDLIRGARTEELSAKHQPGRVIVVAKGEAQSAVCLQLAHVPRPGTLQIQWDGGSVSTAAVRAHRNILALTVPHNAKKLGKHPFVVRYLPDTGQSAETAPLSVRGGEVYVGTQRLSDIVAGDPAGG
jgi:hypothetical protein